jgi:hypothetical protein
MKQTIQDNNYRDYTSRSDFPREKSLAIIACGRQQAIPGMVAQ